MKTRDLIGARRRQDPESGQAMVEFALILFPLLLLVVGIIQFGIALNFWLDEQRIANQGARWAVVNSWPNCPRTEPVPLTGSNCTGANTLQAYLKAQALSKGLKDSVTVTVCYPSVTKAVGDPVKVRLAAPFRFLPIIGVGTITLGADATMRLEQTPTHVTGALASC